jgi:hypothetical protein
MRCVLPHIPNPWDFLVDIMNCNPDSYFLVEFQNLDWIIENKLWWGISYDHVNLFTIQDFKNRFKVEMSGVFGKGEWNWVLFKSQKINLKVSVVDLRLVDKLELLSQYRIETLVKLKEYFFDKKAKELTVEIENLKTQSAILKSLEYLKNLDLPMINDQYKSAINKTTGKQMPEEITRQNIFDLYKLKAGKAKQTTSQLSKMAKP